MWDMDTDDLYGLALDRFVAERGALAKELRKAGRREAATEAAALRKPSVAAWAVNQLVRTQGAAVQELFDAGDALRDAQAELLSGEGSGRMLRAAGERQRAAVDELVERARGLLSSAGSELSAAVVDRVSDTLHAAALDEDAREQVRDGRLERELRHVGLGFGLGAGVAPVGPARGKKSSSSSGDPSSSSGRASSSGGVSSSSGDPSPSSGASKRRGATPAAGSSSSTGRTRAVGRQEAAGAARAERERAAEQRAEEERARRERAAARRDARAAHATARRRADAATAALQAAEEQRDQAAQALRGADEALTAARADAAEADATLTRAQADLDEAEGAG